ncbi:MAG: hypothetical protein JXQ68_03765 [Campylobacterales bacterium]|nr:hypothetical protein [Campylobacterales bacterium]
MTKKIVKIAAYTLLFIFLAILYTMITFWFINLWLNFPPGEIKCSNQPGALFLGVSFFETPLIIATNLGVFTLLFRKTGKKIYLYLHLPVTLFLGALYATIRIISLGASSI